MATHAILRTVVRYQAAAIRTLGVRSTAPVYPGETVRFELWRRDTASFHLRARLDARAAIVLDNDRVELA